MFPPRSPDHIAAPIQPAYNPDQTDGHELKMGDEIDADSKDWANSATQGLEGALAEAAISAVLVAAPPLLNSEAEIAAAENLEHSFDSHASEWFGRAVTRTGDWEAWRELVTRASRSKTWFEWSTGGDATYASLMKVGNDWLVVQFYKEGRNAGQFATAFRPNAGQLTAILRILKKAK